MDCCGCGRPFPQTPEGNRKKRPKKEIPRGVAPVNIGGSYEWIAVDVADHFPRLLKVFAILLLK